MSHQILAVESVEDDAIHSFRGEIAISVISAVCPRSTRCTRPVVVLQSLMLLSSEPVTRSLTKDKKGHIRGNGGSGEVREGTEGRRGDGGREGGGGGKGVRDERGKEGEGGKDGREVEK